MSFAAGGLVGLIASHTERSQRLALLDVARGLAALAMIWYYFAWDLAYFGWARFDMIGDPFWIFARALILGCFLFIAGASLALSAERGIRFQPFIRRLTLIAGGAALVTLVTLISFPETFVFFGALHHLVVGSVLALLFLPLPAVASALLGVACLLLPAIAGGRGFDQPLLWWLGLGTIEPRSNDYVPLFPWFGVMLLGLACGNLVRRDRGLLDHLRLLRPDLGPAWPLAAIGRHTLLVYLAVLPLMFGAVKLASLVYGDRLGGLMPPEAYLRSCERAGAPGGAKPEVAAAFCRCNLDRYVREGMWRGIAEGTVTPAMEERIADIARTCLALTETR